MILLFLFFRIIHENGYTHEECLSFVPVVHNNTIQSLMAIVQAMGQLRIEFGHPDRVVSFTSGGFIEICIFAAFFYFS